MVVCTIISKYYPDLESSFDTNYGTINVAVSLTALLCGLFVVGTGGLADRYGR